MTHEPPVANPQRSSPDCERDAWVAAVAEFTGYSTEEVRRQNQQISLTEILCDHTNQKKEP